MNSKKAELAKLKQQIEQSTTENGSNKSLPMHIEYPTNKRTRQEISDADTSEDEVNKIQFFCFFLNIFLFNNFRLKNQHNQN